LGSGISGTAVYALALDQNNGNIYAGGYFYGAGGLTLTESIAQWNGSSWSYIDLTLPGSPEQIYSLATFQDTLMIGYGNLGSVITSYINIVTNSGSAATYPKFTFTGPGALYQLSNLTTGKAIYFNITLGAGEVATLDLDPNTLSFTSSFRGNIRNTILSGSDMDLYLLPGDNQISLFVGGTTTAATKVTLVDHEAFNSLDGTVR
jgi:hypothetical protein